MSSHPLLQLKILGVAIICEVAFMTWMTPDWLNLVSPLISLSRPGSGLLAGW
jgi:hypothetical protein